MSPTFVGLGESLGTGKPLSVTQEVSKGVKRSGVQGKSMRVE